ncbi:alpha/beta hydrolase [Sabulilitoribacter arenilitoris]|uniref:Alpha/beta hydrolase n=1 Tax=Wocania arenilitoris TaxID=2044858 RepID=A0AAE3EQZ4_9FLAO|nr:alpha/beta hydrolase [Wocania arenilitoris]MCF7569313.1 alpha/beta hydrolase [Wocania arenilitoris]
MLNLKKEMHIIGGHSQGAKMASKFIYENLGLFKGLFSLETILSKRFRFYHTGYSKNQVLSRNGWISKCVSEVLENKNKLLSKYEPNINKSRKSFSIWIFGDY